MAERDRADPQAFLVEVRKLQQRAESDGAVPAAQMGMLYMLLSVATFETLDYAGALPLMERAADYYTLAGDAPERVAEVYNNQASIFRRLKRFDEAEASAIKALSIRRELYGTAHRDVSSSLHTLGNIYFSQGRIEEATATLREAVAAQEAADSGDYPRLVLRLDGLAAFLNESGRDAEAVVVARRSEELARTQLGQQHTLFGTVLNTLSINLLDAGHYSEAIPVIRETLRVRASALGTEHPWTASTQMMLATALEQTGRLEEAGELSAHAVGIMMQHRDVIDTATLAGIHLSVARLTAARQDWPAYDRSMAEGLADVEANLTESNPARALLHVFHASVLHRRGPGAEALVLAERWVPVMQAALIPRHKDRIWAELLLARLRQQAGGSDWTLADEAIGRLVDKLGDLGTSDTALVREARTHRDAALLYLEMAATAGDGERSFAALQLANISELSLGQQFASRSDETGESAAAAAQAALLERTRKAEEVRARYGPALERGEPDAAALAAQLAELERQRAAAEAALRRDFPEYVALRRPQPVGLAALQGSLRGDDVLIAPVENADGGWLVSVTRAGLEARALPADIGERAARLRRAVEAVGSDPFPFADAHALFRALLPQGAPRGGRVLLYGGGTLATLPLGVLTTREHRGGLRDAPWLVRQAAFQVVGNVALFARAAPAAVRARDMVMIGVGGPGLPRPSGEGVELAGLFRSGRPAMESIADLPALPHAAQELRLLAAALPGERDVLLTGPDAAEENFKKASLAEADVIAFATHGLVSGELRNVWEPTLLLGTNAPDSGEDGLLGASEIARLTLKAEWVILSACNTSAGDGAGGPVFSGLATAFSQAGAKALMLSHWQVRDDAAARLSVETVRGAGRGLARAQALRRAQLGLIGDRKMEQAAHPAVWAPFVIIEN